MCKSTVATDALIGENRLQSSVPTRWNSQLIMIKSILKVDQDKLNALDTAKLAAYERNTLRYFVEILSPFEEATDIAQIENKVSSSLVIPCIRGIRDQLSILRMKYSNALVKELAESVERRLAIYESEDTYTTASILDPRFKLKWCKDGYERDHHKSKLLSKMYKIENKKSNRPVVVECKSGQPKSKTTKLFSFMDSDEEEKIYTRMNQSLKNIYSNQLFQETLIHLRSGKIMQIHTQTRLISHETSSSSSIICSC